MTARYKMRFQDQVREGGWSKWLDNGPEREVSVWASAPDEAMDKATTLLGVPEMPSGYNDSRRRRTYMKVQELYEPPVKTASTPAAVTETTVLHWASDSMDTPDAPRADG